MAEAKGKVRRRQRRRFTDEYKAQTVKLVLSGHKTAGQVARDLDLTETAVRHWVKQARVDAGKGPPGVLTSAEKEELSRLRKEVHTLRLEREILIRAAVGSGGERSAPMVDRAHGKNWTPWIISQGERRSLGEVEMRSVAQ
jgi:transposase